MTELDLGLKVGARRLLWSMGYSTRLDVVLRGGRRPSGSDSRATGQSVQNHREDTKTGRPRNTRGGGPETFTDLDVLGVLVAPGLQLSTIIADCKSGLRDKPTARMFWVRGVADLFGADQVMLVREHDVNDATRQLSSRLGITVLPSPDLIVIQQLHELPIGLSSGPASILFDRQSVAAYLSAFDGLDRRLASLLEYRDYDYWVYEPHRNPIQLVAHLRDSAKNLDPRNPIHLALFLDMAWLYTLALVRVLAHVRGAFLRDPDRGIQEYLFGGPTNLIEKQEIAALLRTVAPPGAPNLDHLPDYYSNLRELVTRLLRRPDELQSALQYAEISSALIAARNRVTLPDALGHSFRPIAAKLVADVCGFLVASAGLQPDFRSHARAWLLAEGGLDDPSRARGRSRRGHASPGEEPTQKRGRHQDAASGRPPVEDTTSAAEPEQQVHAVQQTEPSESAPPDHDAPEVPEASPRREQSSRGHEDSNREQGVLNLESEPEGP